MVMKNFEFIVDQLTESLLCGFASKLIYRLATEIKVDPDELALRVKGLIHDHWYVAEESVTRCAYCQRIDKLNRSASGGMPAIPIEVHTTGISNDTKHTK